MTILDNNTESGNLLNVQQDEWSGVSIELPSSKRQGICAHCNLTFSSDTGAGRPKKYCSPECRTKAKAACAAAEWAKKAESVNGLHCEHCATALKGEARRFCSRLCQQSVDRPGAYMPRKIKDRPCEQCGTLFRPQGTRDAGRFCSRACRKIGMRSQTGLHCCRPMEPATCVECGGLYEKLCKTHLTCSSECLIKRSTRRQQVRKNPERYATKPCLECGKLFTPVYGEYSKGRCSLECKAKAKARNVKKGRRVQKAKRRAVERGAEADSIDPIKIFERDRWRCQLCGRNTPKALRGKNQPASPELDHIVPLSRGGPHTYANTQCACRECNGNKGATIMGQLNFNL